MESFQVAFLSGKYLVARKSGTNGELRQFRVNNWKRFICQSPWQELDHLWGKQPVVEEKDVLEILARTQRVPIASPHQRMLACGVTYFASEQARDEEFRLGGDISKSGASQSQSIVLQTPYTYVGNPEHFAANGHLKLHHPNS